MPTLGQCLVFARIKFLLPTDNLLYHQNTILYNFLYFNLLEIKCLKLLNDPNQLARLILIYKPWPQIYKQ